MCHWTSWDFTADLLAFRLYAVDLPTTGGGGVSHPNIIARQYYSTIPFSKENLSLYLSFPPSGCLFALHRQFITRMPSLQPHSRSRTDRKVMDPRFHGWSSPVPFDGRLSHRRLRFAGLQFQKRSGNQSREQSVFLINPFINSRNCNSRMSANTLVGLPPGGRNKNSTLGELSHFPDAKWSQRS